jgi:hypothetical protein
MPFYYQTGESMCSKSIILLTLTFSFFASLGAFGQAQPSASPQAPTPSKLPFTTQIKKSVVFIRTNCVHMTSDQELAAMSPEDRARWTDEGIAKLKPEELARLRQDSYIGTGFIVSILDERLGKDMGFSYLVTNRHVVQPGIENGKPCKVVNYSISINHIGMPANPMPYLQSLPVNPEGVWAFPDDDTVDLAATQFPLSNTKYDFMTIPINLFVTQEMIQKNEVVEGDPVIFTGLFIQYAGIISLEPVVRSGAIAMVPQNLIQTTLHKLGHVYLAEAHAFGGNSGSPMFVDVNKFKNSFGFDYKFLGVVTGEIQETEDLTLNVTTTYKGTVSANSNVSVIVPAFEVNNLLMSPTFQHLRDAYVALHPAAQPMSQQPIK